MITCSSVPKLRGWIAVFNFKFIKKNASKCVYIADIGLNNHNMFDDCSYMFEDFEGR